MYVILCSAGQREGRYLEWMSKYGIRMLQEKREGGFTECPEGGVSVCVHVRVRVCACRKRLQSVHVSPRCSVRVTRPAELCARGRSSVEFRRTAADEKR